MPEIRPYDPYPDRDSRLRLLVGLVAGVALIMIVGALFGEFDIGWLLVGIGAAAFSVTLVFIAGRQVLMGRWVLPFARRLENLVARCRATASLDEVHWFMRVRIQMLVGLVEGVIVCAFVGIAVGSLQELLALGFVLGLGMVLVWAALWTVRRDQLESRGFRW